MVRKEAPLPRGRLPFQAAGEAELSSLSGGEIGRNQHPPIVVKAYESFLEQDVDVRDEQETVIRIEALPVVGRAPWLDMGSPEQFPDRAAGNGAGVAPAFIEIVSKLALSLSSLNKRRTFRLWDRRVTFDFGNFAGLVGRRRHQAPGQVGRRAADGVRVLLASQRVAVVAGHGGPGQRRRQEAEVGNRDLVGAVSFGRLDLLELGAADDLGGVVFGRREEHWHHLFGLLG